ncbi:MAG: hypothetical protein JW795_23715 [Chitinivibrionales bacterium]|nr:hypothetical protein [Chitinivibrionales bacterium]
MKQCAFILSFLLCGAFVYSGDGPSTMDAVAVSMVEVKDSLPKLADEAYGILIDKPYPPYLEQRASIHRFQLDSLLRRLFPKGIPRPRDTLAPCIPISSTEHKERNWTYIKSRTLLLYEFKKITIEGKIGSCFAALYSSVLPHEIVADFQHTDWHLVVVDSTYAILADCPFKTPIHSIIDEWDMIYTLCEIKKGMAVVTITYASTGSGGTYEPEFVYTFALQKQEQALKLTLKNKKHIPPH